MGKTHSIRGVMGGDFSEVTEQTRHVVVEGAIFDPVSIRHTSRRLNLEANHRVDLKRGLQLNSSMKL